MPQLGEIRKGKEIGYYGTTRHMWCACKGCGKQRWVRYIVKQSKPVEAMCGGCAALARGNKMENNSNWKGGRVKRSGGYIVVRVSPTDFFYPMVMTGKGNKGKQNYRYVMEHRLVMAKHLNRCLLTWEVVHHKNGVRDDNRLENLELLPNPSKHSVLTRMASYIKKLEREIELLRS